MALRPADLPARRVEIPRAPFKRDGHHAVEAVQVIEQVRRGPAGRGHQRIQNHGLAVQSKMPAFGFEFAVRQPPVHPTAGRPLPRRAAGLVNQLREHAGAGVCREDFKRGEVGDQRTTRIDLLPKARRRVVDLLSEVDRLVGIPPPFHPRPYVALPPRLIVAARRRRRQARVVTPREIGVDLLDARGKERAPLPLPQVGDRRQAGIGLGEDGRPAQEVEIDPGPGVDAGEHPLPAVQHGVKLLGGVTVNDGRRQPGECHQLAAPGETRPVVGEPAPIGQLVGERAGRVMVGDVAIGRRHDRVSRRAGVMRMYHGCAAHFAGS